MYEDLFRIKIAEDKKLVSCVLNSINYVFNSSVLNEIFQNDYHIVKYKVFNDYAIIFDKFKDRINVFYCKNFSYFYNNESEFKKYLLKQDYSNQELFLFNYFYKYDYGNNNPFEKTNSIKEKILNCLSFYAKIILNEQHIFSNNPNHFKILIDFLNQYANLNYSFDENSSMNIIKKSLHLYQNSISEINQLNLKLINHFNLNHNHSFDTAFIFENGNKAWLINNLLIFSPKDIFDSSYDSIDDFFYCIHFEDESNFSIYLFDILFKNDDPIFVEYQNNFSSISFIEFLSLKIEDQIKNKTINNLKNTIISLSNNNITYLNSQYYHTFYIFLSLNNFD